MLLTLTLDSPLLLKLGRKLLRRLLSLLLSLLWWLCRGCCRDARNLQLSTIGNDNLLGGLARLAAERLDLLNDVHALDDGAEDNVTVVEPGSLDSGDKELRTVGVRAGVGHRHDAGSGVLQGEVLILELVAVDGLATSSVVVGEIAALAHEVGDDTVESGAFVSESLLAGAQCSEVFTRFWSYISSQLDDDTTERLVVSLHIEKYTSKRHFA